MMANEFVTTWLPLIAFMITGLLYALAGRRYRDALARRGLRTSNQDVAQEMQRDLPAAPALVGRFTMQMLHDLATPQADHRLERSRHLAGLSLLAMVLCFAWTVVSWMGPG